MTRLAPRSPRSFARAAFRKRPYAAVLAVLCTITCRDLPTAPATMQSAPGMRANAGSGLTITPARDTILIGQSFTLTATNSNGSPLTKTAAWTSSDTSVAVVVSTGLATGRVTGKKVGSVTITATSSSKSGTNSTTVVPVPVRSVLVTPDTASREPGDSAKYTATPKDSAGNTLTGRTVVWSSSDTTIAKVTTATYALARARGVAQVRATSEGVTGTATFTVRVPQLTVSAITTTDSANAGDSIRVVYTVANLWDDPNADSVIVRVGLRNGTGTVLAAVRRALPRVRGAQSRTDSTKLAIGAASGAGNYDVVAYADCKDSGTATDVARLTSCLATPATAGSIAEGVETDNSRSATIITRRPELTATDIASADTLFTRTTAVATVGISNSGSVTPRNFDVLAGVYDVTASAFVAAGAATTPALGSRASASVPVSIAMPASADASHSYELRAYVDCAGSGSEVARLTACFATPDTGAVAEGNDANNSLGRATFVRSNIARVAILPDSVPLSALGDSAAVAATAYDRADATVPSAAFTWTSLDPTVAAVVAGNGGSAVVHALTNGVARVVAQSDNRSDTIRVVVFQLVFVVSTTPSSVTLSSIGATSQLSAAAVDHNGNAVAGASFTWTSLEPAIATVNGTGLVTAAAPGSARIVATSGGRADTTQVTVTQVAARVVASPDSVTLAAVGDTAQLAAVVFDANDHVIPGAPVAWTSLAAAYASVSASGRVTAVANGSASIVATSGGHADTVRAIVVQQVASVSTAPASVALTALGATAQLSASATDRNGNAVAGASFTWTSLDASVASVSAAGLVTSVGVGSARIVATSNGRADTTQVAVTQAVARVAVSPDSVAIGAIGDTAQLGAVVYDANDHPIPAASVSWSVADASVATVSATGRVSAVANGGTSVIATADGHADTARVVVQQQVARVVVQQDSIVVHAVLDTARYTASLFDANGNPVSAAVTWTSLDPALAEPASNGAFVAGISVVNGQMVTVGQVVASSSGHADTARFILDQVGARMRLDPDSVVIPGIGRQYRFSVTVYDSNNYALYNPRVQWTSLNTSVATVNDSTGMATTIAIGRAPIVAVSGAAVDTAILGVDRIVASVSVSPDSTLLSVGGTVTLVGTALDETGSPIAEKPVTWSTTDASVATVTPAGVVNALADGAALIVAYRDQHADTAAIFVNPVGYSARWTGANGMNGAGSWSDAGNWMPHQVPDASSNVYVPAGVANHPDLGEATVLAGNLKVAAGAQVRGGASSVLAAYGNVEFLGTASFAALEMRGSGSLRGALPNVTVASDNASSAVMLAGRTSAASVTIGGNSSGRLVVNGQTLQANVVFVAPGGSVDESNAADSIVVLQDATWMSNGAGTPSALTAGVLAVGGNFTSNGAGAFSASGTHKIAFTGVGSHSVTTSDTTALFQDVDVGGTLAFGNTATIGGRMRLLNGARVVTQNDYSGTLHFTSALPETEAGSYEVGMTLVTGDITLDRNYSIPSRMYVDQGGSLRLGGHRLEVLSFGTYAGTFTMNDSRDTMVVHDYSQFYGANHLTAGTYIAMGGVSVGYAPQVPGSGWFVSGTHKMVFDGSSPQSVSLGDSATANLQNVEIRNTQGVTLGRATVRGLMTFANGARLVGDYNSLLKFTSQLPVIGAGSYEVQMTLLTGPITASHNERIPGYVYVDQGGSLTLAGHTLETMGFGTYAGTLTMNNAADTLIARQYAQFYGLENLSAGAMVVSGGLSVNREPSVPGAGWHVSGTHTTIFEGTTPVDVSFGDTTLAELNHVEVRNTAGVTVGGNANIRGRMHFAQGGRLLTNNNGTLKFWSDLPDVAMGSLEVPYIIVPGQITMTRNERVPTNIYVDGGGSLRLGGHKLEVMTMGTYRGTLVMDNPADTLIARTGGNFYGLENLSDGNMIVMGDLNVTREPSVPGAGWNVSGAHKTTFAGSQQQMVYFPDSVVANLQHVDVSNGSGVIFNNSATVNGRMELLGGRVLVGNGNSILKFTSELPRVGGGMYEVPLTFVTGPAVATENGFFSGSVYVENGGNLDVNGHKLDINNFGTHGGTLTMSNAADTLIARQYAQFYGAANLSAGTLMLMGDVNFSNMPGLPSAFNGGGTHTTVFAGGFTQQLDMPDDGLSHFGNLRIDNQNGVNIQDSLDVRGALMGSGAGSLRSQNGNVVHIAGGLDVAGLMLDGVFLDVNGGQLTRFDNVVFSGRMAPAQLRIRHAGTGGTFTMNNISFLVGSTEGALWVDAEDTDGGSPLTLDITSAQHADGPANTRTSNGAVVTWRAPAVGNDNP